MNKDSMAQIFMGLS